MAYHCSSFHGDGDHYFIDDGEYPLTHYYYNYPRYQHDYAPAVQDSAIYRSDYVDEDEYPSFSSSSEYYYAYASMASEPLFLTHYSESSQTRPVVSYSELEFNEDDYFEYDPTPYGGGYDLVQTFGNPLPHSDETCYPRSTANPIPAAAGGSSIAAAPGKQPQLEIEKKPTIPKLAPEEAMAGIGTIPHSDDTPADPIPAGEQPQMEIEKEPTNPKVPTEEAVGKGVGGYRNLPPGRVIPTGSGLEAVDLCESLFGYWPCLEKCKRETENDYGVKKEVIGDWNETAADYLFGSWYDPYCDDGERRREENRWGYYDYQWRPDEVSEIEEPLPLYRRPAADMYVEDLWYNDSTSSSLILQ